MNFQQSYREAAVLGASPVGLVVRLYEKMIDDLRQVADAVDKKDIQRRSDRIRHAILIVGHLQSSLDFEAGGKVARDLENLYNTWRGNLLHMQFHPSKGSARQLITDLLTVRKAWITVEQAESGEAMAGRTAPYIAAAGESAGEADRPHGDWQG